MLLDPTAALWFLLCVFPIAIWVAWSDLARMKIPNKAVLALLVVYLVVGILTLPFETYLWQMLNFAVILAAGFLLSVIGALGAGDAKFAAAAAPFVMVADVFNLIFILAAWTLFGFISHRLARISPIRKLVPDWESWERTKDFPLGYPLAATLVTYLIFAVFM